MGYKYKQYVYATNGSVGLECLKYLLTLDTKCRYLVLHPEENRRENDQLMQIAIKHNINTFNTNEFNTYVRSNKEEFNEDILISVYYGYIIPDNVLTSFKETVNLHPSYLPYNKGVYPNIWSIVEETPAGVSLHRMVKKVDEGPIFYQRKTKKYTYDTGESLYRRLEADAIDLFTSKIEAIFLGDVKPFIPEDNGTFHLKKEIVDIDEIDLEGTYKAKDLINIIRARTFEGYKGAYFIDPESKRKVYLKIVFKKGD